MARTRERRYGIHGVRAEEGERFEATWGVWAKTEAEARRKAETEPGVERVTEVFEMKGW